ncbi:MAG: DNA replication/repair protein RecF [Rhabdochlamydiaceae bacterium]
MYIESLYLHHFRNYREETFNFSPHVNLICGDNAQGKTNLLEALFLVGTGRSFRTPHLKELIHKEAPFFFIEAQFSKDEIQQKIRLSFDGEIKKLETNHTSYAYFNPLLGQLPIVLLAPEDVLLISGAPADRRRFLDLHLAQSDPLYVYHITRYHKAIKHRNFLLKQKKEEGLEPWETLMVAAANYIRQKRSHLIEDLKEDLKSSMLTLSNKKDEMEIRYHPSFTDNYLKYRAKELQIGSTLLGPHRDDLEILINGLPASGYASQGQFRSAVAALRLAQWKNLAKEHRVSPLFCIDDFGVHLDEERREALLCSVTTFGQVFLTSPVFLENRPYHTLQITSGSLIK